MKNEKHLITCECDICMSACDELNPYCGNCFICEEKENEDTWWKHNREDCLQI